MYVFQICFAAALAAPTDKQKREILPGDPRYGTDYHHHHHHHHENENEVEISKAAGGYVGSFSGNAKAHSTQLSTSYGPPNFIPGKPLGPDQHTIASSDTIQNPTPIQVPATSYGIPDIQVRRQSIYRKSFNRELNELNEFKHNFNTRKIHRL